MTPPLSLYIPPPAVDACLGSCLAALRELMVVGERYRVTGELREDGSMVVRAEPVPSVAPADKLP